VRRALSETSSRACLDASTDAITGATTDGLVPDGSNPSIVCIASARAVPPVGRVPNHPSSRTPARGRNRTDWTSTRSTPSKGVSSTVPTSARSAVEVTARFPAGSPPDRWRRSEARRASQITAAAGTSQPAPLDFEESSSKFTAASAIHVPGGSRMFRFVVPGIFCSNLSSGR
jgi:hypothetical protein